MMRQKQEKNSEKIRLGRGEEGQEAETDTGGGDERLRATLSQYELVIMPQFIINAVSIIITVLLFQSYCCSFYTVTFACGLQIQSVHSAMLELARDCFTIGQGYSCNMRYGILRAKWGFTQKSQWPLQKQISNDTNNTCIQLISDSQ